MKTAKKKTKKSPKKKLATPTHDSELQDIRDEIAELGRRILNLEQEIRYLGDRNDLT